VQNATIPCRSHELLLLLRYVPFHATLLHHLFYHAISPHLATYFLVYLSFFLFPNSYITHFWEFYFLPFCTCPNQHNLFNLNASIIVGFLILAKISLLVNILQFSFPLSYTGPYILLYICFQKCPIVFYLSFLVSRFLTHMLIFCLLLCSLVFV